MDESIQQDTSEEHFVVIKSDDSIELYSISKAFEDLPGACDVVVAKDLLKGLLHDRGKGENWRNLQLGSFTYIVAGVSLFLK